ncbi:MAG: AgmX/PglI C-terminal domain-containing protein [Deltaproteobacteria bacterium]|nr:AgmX/PglI C-terminal domain-containing protein [Deltaproteobacteria bacterium]
MSGISKSDMTRLLAFLDGKIDATKRAHLEARMAQEPALKSAWERLKATQALCRDLGEAEPPEVSYRHIEAQVRWRSAQEDDARATRQASRRPWRVALTLAATIALGALTGVALDRYVLRADPGPSADRPHLAAIAPSSPAVAPQPAIAPRAPTPTPERPLAALAIVLRGEVNVTPRDGTTVPLRIERPLLPGDRILTGPNGAVTLQWADGTGTRLGPDGELELRHLTETTQRLALFRGRARFAVKPTTEFTHARRFEVLAGNVRLHVVGTRFGINFADDATEVEVTRGKVQIFPFDAQDPDRMTDDGVLVQTRHRVRVPRRGGAPTISTFTPDARRLYLLPWSTLARVLAETGPLRVETKPEGVEARLDAIAIGQTNLRLRGRCGRHLLELWRNGRRLRRRWVQIGQGKTRITLHLGAVHVASTKKVSLSAPILRIIRRRTGSVRACYERRLKTTPHLNGSFRLHIDIAADGHVTHVRVTDDNLGDPLVGRCAAATVKRWRNPPDEPTTYNVPFIFHPRH